MISQKFDFFSFIYQLIKDFEFSYTLYMLIFCSLLIIFAYLFLTTHNNVFASLYLVSVFIIASVTLFIVGLDFFALLIIIVYVGAIIMLFLFVIMMLNIVNSNGTFLDKKIPLITTFFICICIHCNFIYKKHIKFGINFDGNDLNDHFSNLYRVADISIIKHLIFKFLQTWLPEYLGLYLFSNDVWLIFFLIVSCLLALIMIFSISIVNEYRLIIALPNMRSSYYFLNKNIIYIYRNMQYN